MFAWATSVGRPVPRPCSVLQLKARELKIATTSIRVALAADRLIGTFLVGFHITKEIEQILG